MDPVTRRRLIVRAAAFAAGTTLCAPFAAADSKLSKLRPGAAPAGPQPRALKLYNAGTKETYDAVYHDGTAITAKAQEALDWFMRDFHENQATKMDPALFDQLWRFQQAVRRAGLGTGPLWIHSAYRTQKTNDALKREGAAHNSRHLTGQAADVTVPGHGIFNYERLAEMASTGGLGLYYWSHFVHFDSGPRRVWTQPR